MNDPLRQRSVGAPAARSVLLTVLGEYVLPLDDAVWLETLLNALEVLDYKSQAARQALARSVADGWLSSQRRGRRARLRLTADTEQMLRIGAEGIYSFGGARLPNHRAGFRGFFAGAYTPRGGALLSGPPPPPRP